MKKKIHTPIPETGFLRIQQIVGDPKATPPVPALLPISRSTFLAGVKAGKYPAAVKPFGPRVTCWRVEDIRALIEKAAA